MLVESQQGVVFGNQAHYKEEGNIQVEGSCDSTRGAHWEKLQEEVCREEKLQEAECHLPGIQVVLMREEDDGSFCCLCIAVPAGTIDNSH